MTSENSDGSHEPSDPTASLSPNGRKARYGVAYVRAICAQAGVLLTEMSPDEDVLAVDCLVGFAEAEVRVQVKCSSQTVPTASKITWPLREGWVMNWKRTKTPIYFVAVLVPPNWEDWIDHPPEQTLHRTSAYWTRVRGQDLGSSIAVPTTSRLTAECLAVWHQDLRAVYSPGAQS